VELIEFRDWKLRCDREATRHAYERAAREEPEECSCEYCRNFASARDRVFPSEVLTLFSRLGIDHRLSPEVFHYKRLGPRRHLYGGWFHFVGSIEAGPNPKGQGSEGAWSLDLVPITPDFRLGFTSKSALYFRAFLGLPIVQVEFEAEVPWVLELPEWVEGPGDFIGGVLEENNDGATYQGIVYDRSLTLRHPSGRSLEIFDCFGPISTGLLTSKAYDMIVSFRIPWQIQRAWRSPAVLKPLNWQATVITPRWTAPRVREAYDRTALELYEKKWVLVSTWFGRALVHPGGFERRPEVGDRLWAANPWEGGFMRWENTRLDLLAVRSLDTQTSRVDHRPTRLALEAQLFVRRIVRTKQRLRTFLN